MAHENESDKANEIERERGGMGENGRYKERKEEIEIERERAGNGMIIIK